jgi:hypothetical protein
MALRVTMQGSAYQDRQQIAIVYPSSSSVCVPSRATAGDHQRAALSAEAPCSTSGSRAHASAGNVNQEIAVASVTPEYFQAIGTPLRRGRGFTDRDHAQAPLVVLVNDATVRSWFQNQDAVGKYVTVGGQRREIVGIVGDVLQRDPGRPAIPQLFAPFAQRTTSSIRIVIRAAGDPLALAPAIRSELRALDPNHAITDFTPLERLVSTSVARPASTRRF